MLISDTRDFIFVHNYKVAGSSIKSALETYATAPIRYAGWFRRQLSRIGLVHIPDYPPHSKAKEIKEQEPSRWNRYFTFGFVRNPWSWQVSLYSYMLETEGHHQHDLISSMQSFDEYIHWRVDEDKHLQSEFFCNEDGDIIVDYIGRLESIREDFQTICERIGVEASLPHKNSSSHRDYRKYYTDRTRRLIAEHFVSDIERFGYSFDGMRDSTPITT